MEGESTLDTVLDVCRHKDRRIVLATLADQQQPMSINDLTNAIIKHNHHLPQTEADDEMVKWISVGLQHVHLPKLAATGFIQYDPERNVAQLKSLVGQDGSHFTAILAMDSELPTTSRDV